MEYKKTNDKDVAKLIAEQLTRLLDHRCVTWFISGGSNIEFEYESVQILKNHPHIARLTILLIDERYGIVGHKDSNWQQLRQARFMIDGPRFIAPFTENEITLEGATKRFETILQEIVNSDDYLFAQLGIGSDGHIAGILPNSAASIQTDVLAIGYESAPYNRLTVSFSMLQKLDEAVLVALGDDKRHQLERLKQSLTLDNQPAQIVKHAPRVTIYTKER